MIKIITGWSNAGGSTTAFINLTKELNKRDIQCKLFGPHQWHLDKCNSGSLQDINLSTDDVLILHFFNTPWTIKPPIKGKLIYSCHEKEIKPITSFNYKIYDKIHYVSKPQKEWHKVDHPHFILPNVVEELKVSEKEVSCIAGIIGSIDENKQTHKSIERALSDKMERIYLYGNITDTYYYHTKVKPLIDDNSNIIHKGYVEDTQNIYNEISDVYLSSISETWSYIKKECDMTGKIFHGTDAVRDNFNNEMTNDEIINKWKEVLEIQ